MRMGTWMTPFKTAAKARQFARLMEDPWIATVKLVRSQKLRTVAVKKKGLAKKMTKVPVRGNKMVESWDYDVPKAWSLVGTDALYDAIADQASSRQADFDVRPLMRRFVMPMVTDALENPRLPAPSMESLLVVAAAVGMRISPRKQEEYRARAAEKRARKRARG